MLKRKKENDENKGFSAQIIYLEKVYKFNNFKSVIGAISWWTWFILIDLFSHWEKRSNKIFKFKWALYRSHEICCTNNILVLIDFWL